MPDTKLLDKSLGTRHSAALGITEETDAVVVVVSEERGTISFCFNGNIVPNLDGTALRQTLVGLLGQKNKKAAVRITAPPPQRATDGRPSGAAARRETEPASKGRVESATATPLPGSRPSTPPRGATATPIRTLADADRARAVDADRPRTSDPDRPRGVDAAGDGQRPSTASATTSTLPLVTSKPMPRASLMPPARDDKALDSSRPSSLSLDAGRDAEPPPSDRTPLSSGVASNRAPAVEAEADEGDRASFVPKVPMTPADPVRGGEDS